MPRPAVALPALLIVQLLAQPALGQAPGGVAPGATPTTGEPVYLKDRGAGIGTSMFGTYVRSGEWLIYPFFEYYRHERFEYKPEEFGVAGSQDFRGRFRAAEQLLFVAYGLSDAVAFEAEAAVISASLDKAVADSSALPGRIQESGLGDVEGQIRWRWRKEDEGWPELFSYAEVVVPHHRNKALIGTSGWELKAGTGLTRGFSWGTVTARIAMEYATASASHVDLGEYAVEYLKRLTPRWRVYLGLEGTQDEVSMISEAQWHLGRQVFVRFNNSVGLTSKAIDWAPEIGVVFSFRPARQASDRQATRPEVRPQ